MQGGHHRRHKSRDRRRKGHGEKKKSEHHENKDDKRKKDDKHKDDTHKKDDKHKDDTHKKDDKHKDDTHKSTAPVAAAALQPGSDGGGEVLILLATALAAHCFPDMQSLTSDLGLAAHCAIRVACGLFCRLHTGCLMPEVATDHRGRQHRRAGVACGARLCSDGQQKRARAATLKLMCTRTALIRVRRHLQDDGGGDGARTGTSTNTTSTVDTSGSEGPGSVECTSITTAYTYADATDAHVSAGASRAALALVCVSAA